MGKVDRWAGLSAQGRSFRSPLMTDSPQIHIPDRAIGENEPCFIIAEAGINHNGSLGMALKLVDAAADAGADAVKFQLRDMASLYPDALLKDANRAEWAFQYILPALRDSELCKDVLSNIRDRCDERRIRFMCTPWDEPSLEFVESLGVDLHKAGSPDLVNLPLLGAIADTGKPLIISTGMSTRREIERTVEFLEGKQAQFALLHCVSTYPAPFENLNLSYLETLKSFGVPVGYSGHERGIAVALAARALGACILEKHITLDRTLPGPDHPASLEPAGMSKLVRDVRNFELALGHNEKTLSAMEVLNREVLRKSLVAAHHLPKGTVVSAEMIKVMGPGKGLTPQRLDELVGVTLDRDVEADEYFAEGDLADAVDLTLDTRGLRRPWGLKTRFHDLEQVLELKPDLVEFHFSEDDVDHPFDPPADPYPQQLVIHAPEFAGKRLLDLASLDDERRESSIDIMQCTIDKAVELEPHFTGPVSVVIHVGGMSMDEPVKDVRPLVERAVDSFRRLDARGMALLPENLPPRPWYLGGQWFQNLFTRPEHMVEFCEELGLGMTLDVSHAQLFCAADGLSLFEYVRTCLPHTRHVHLADASGIDGEGIQIGEGVIEWGTLLELLSQEDFTWLPEIWSGHLHRGAGFVEAINRLAAYDQL